MLCALLSAVALHIQYSLLFSVILILRRSNLAVLGVLGKLSTIGVQADHTIGKCNGNKKSEIASMVSYLK